ncbi:hypothetical protein D3C71_2134980 [compost metagenome]
MVQADQRMADEHGVVVHVRAAQVQEPGDVVQRGHEMHIGAVLAHGCTDLGKLVGTGHAGLGRHVFVDPGVG